MILQKNRGNVLIITLLLMMIAVVYVGIVMSQTSTVALNTNRSRQFESAQAAAAGAVDYAYAVWLRRVTTQHNLLAANQLSIPNPPSFPGFDYCTTTGTDDGTLKIQALDKSGVPVKDSAVPDPVVGPVPNYKGWWGYTYTYAATAKVKVSGDPNAPAAGARRLFHYTEVPLFQCMYFFNDDLEIYNPASMMIQGRIHSNKTLYLSTKTSGSNLIVQGLASYVTGYSFTEPASVKGTDTEQYGTDYAPYGANKKTTLAAPQLQKVDPMSPMSADLDTLFSSDGASSNPNLSGSYHELIEVPTSGTSDPIESDPTHPRRLYNIAAQSGIIVHVTGTSIVSATAATTSAVAASNIAITTIGSNGLPVAKTGKSVLITSGTEISLPTSEGTTDYNNAVYAFSQALTKQQATGTNTRFYDAREGSFINLVNVDVKLFNTAVSSALGTTGMASYNNVVYIYDDTTSSYLNGVRLRNGAIISGTSGLTIASQNPVYIKGDYNTGSTVTSATSVVSGTDVPSNVSNSSNDQQNYKTGYTPQATAVISDAVTLLSNSWSDTASYTSSGSGSSLTSRKAANTTYNVALMGGYLTSDSISSDYYSGGAINYPRFIETWDGKYCTYFGSMVELFPSKSKKPWISTADTTNRFYLPPYRRFNFDSNFSSKSPPGSTNAITLSRGLWSQW